MDEEMRIRKTLQLMIMPWRHPTRSGKIIGFMSLISIGLVILMPIWPRIFLWPLLIFLAVYLPVGITFFIMDTIYSRRRDRELMAKLRRLHLACRLATGEVRWEQLTPAEQNDVMGEFARRSRQGGCERDG